jgi:hypothetical protein
VRRPLAVPTAALSLVAAAALGLAGCGERGAGGASGGGAATSAGAGARDAAFVGSWTLDPDRTRDAAFVAAKRQIEATRKRLAADPPEVREQFERSVPKSDDDLRADQQRRTASLTFVLEVRADGSASLVFAGPKGLGKYEERTTGTWETSGADLWLAPQTRNGSPASDGRKEHLVKKGEHLVVLDPEGNELFWLRRG